MEIRRLDRLNFHANLRLLDKYFKVPDIEIKSLRDIKPAKKVAKPAAKPDKYNK